MQINTIVSLLFTVIILIVSIAVFIASVKKKEKENKINKDIFL